MAWFNEGPEGPLLGLPEARRLQPEPNFPDARELSQLALHLGLLRIVRGGAARAEMMRPVDLQPTGDGRAARRDRRKRRRQRELRVEVDPRPAPVAEDGGFCHIAQRLLLNL